MFCSICGKQTNENLNFCNNCGARLDLKTEEFQDRSFALNSVTVTGIVAMFGLFGFVFLTIKLLEKNLDAGSVFMILALYTMAVFGNCFLIFRQTPDRSLKSHGKKKNGQENAPKNLSAENIAQLNPSFQTPVPSVTENTTRTLNEVLIERK